MGFFGVRAFQWSRQSFDALIMNSKSLNKTLGDYCPLLRDWMSVSISSSWHRESQWPQSKPVLLARWAILSISTTEVGRGECDIEMTTNPIHGLHILLYVGGQVGISSQVSLINFSSLYEVKENSYSTKVGQREIKSYNSTESVPGGWRPSLS